MSRNSRYLITTYLCSGSLLATLALFQSISFANPVDGVVKAGNASIDTTSKNVIINQQSDKAVIDWRGFDIASDEATRFNQPNSNSVVLNRVHSATSSKIDGMLTANGNVVLVNPNGIMFGRSSTVDVSGLVATTANISNENFMRGHMEFNHAGNPNTSIINEGAITAKQAGLVGLVAPNVTNNGIITANLGRIQLSTGETATVDLYGDKLMEVAVGDNVSTKLTNTGVLRAEGGQIALTAAAGRNIVDSLITVKGELHAPTIAQEKGEIIISADGANAVSQNNPALKGKKGGNSTVLVSGLLDANGYEAGEKGGNVTITGDHVGVLDGATILANGHSGGGKIRIGGEYKGEGSTSTAKRTIVQKDTFISANAAENGNGGEVIVWSDERTDFSGDIRAKGGKKGGNGGFVETSGKQTLNASGLVNATAPKGNAGMYLLDPNNITIQTAGPDANMSGDPNFTTTTDGGILTTASITANLDNGTPVTITTGNAAPNTEAGDITVNNAIVKNGATAASLELSAFRNIVLNQGISSNAGPLDVTLRANNTGAAGGGYVHLASGQSILTRGGAVNIGGGAGAITPGVGYAVGNAGNSSGVLINGTINAGGGAVIINGRGADLATNSNHGIRISGGTIATSGGGVINLSGQGAGNTNSGSNNGLQIDSVGKVESENGNIIISNTQGGGAGSGTTNHGVLIQNAGSQITTTGSGIINVTALGGNANGSGGTNHGISVETANGIQAQGTGGITLNGTGGNNGGAGTGASNYGINVIANSSIMGNGGAMNITGTGGNSSGNNNRGVVITGANSAISNSGTGTLTLSGTGKGRVSSAANYGLELSNGGVLSTHNGDLKVTNATGGGAGAGNANYGIIISATGSSIRTTGNGNIEVNAQGGNPDGTGGTNLGIALTPANGIQAQGSGKITVTATGGNNGTTGSSTTNHGLMVFGTISGNGGAIDIKGTGGNSSGDSNRGVVVTSAGSAITNTGNGSLTIRGYGAGRNNSGSNYGVEVASGGILSVADGQLIIANATGGGAGSGINNYGLSINGGTSTIRSTGNGSISITANGGNLTGTGGGNAGMHASVVNAVRAQSSGSITINSTGGSSTAGTGTQNHGVHLASGSIVGNGGAINITGAGGSSSGNSNQGIIVAGANAAISNVGSGSIALGGTGGGSGASTDNSGINVANGGVVSTANGALNIASTTGGIGASSEGVRVDGVGSRIRTTGSGGMSLNAAGNVTSTDIFTNITDGYSTTGTGGITMEANSFSIAAANSINSAANLTIRPRTTGAIGVGTAAAGDLVLTDAQLGNLGWGSTGMLTLGGGANTTHVNIATAHNFANPATFWSSGNGNINLNQTLTSSVATGTALTLVTEKSFINNAGANAINPGTGRYLVYSDNPATDSPGGLTPAFTRLACSYNGGCPSIPVNGNGFLYRFSPATSSGAPTTTAEPTVPVVIPRTPTVVVATPDPSVEGGKGNSEPPQLASGQLPNTVEFTVQDTLPTIEKAYELATAEGPAPTQSESNSKSSDESEDELKAGKQSSAQTSSMWDDLLTIDPRLKELLGLNVEGL